MKNKDFMKRDSDKYVTQKSNKLEKTDSIGKRTRKHLDKKGVVAPESKGLVKVKKGMWIIPKETTDIDKLKEKYNKKL